MGGSESNVELRLGEYIIHTEEKQTLLKNIALAAEKRAMSGKVVAAVVK
jgi:hypothetical protein